MRNGFSLWELYESSGRLVARIRPARAYSPWTVTESGDVLASYIDDATGEHVAALLRIDWPVR